MIVLGHAILVEGSLVVGLALSQGSLLNLSTVWGIIGVMGAAILFMDGLWIA